MSEAASLLTLYSDVKRIPIRWVWYPYIAEGKITLLQGDPGDGKSTMMIHLISELSKHGGKTPDGQVLGRPIRVIYQCSEDGAGDVIKARLEECGAECQNIAFINEEIHDGLTLDDERILQAIVMFRPKLIVIDPIQAYIGSGLDMNEATRARKLMRRLGLWASRYHCAVVLIGHMNKKQGSKELYRSLGTIDIIAAARSVLQLERDGEVRTIKQIKNNLAPKGKDIKFIIDGTKGFQWMLVHQEQKPAEPVIPPPQLIPKTKRELAEILLQRELKEKDVAAMDIQSLLKSYGIGNKTMQEAKADLCISSYRRNRRWYWHMELETC